MSSHTDVYHYRGLHYWGPISTAKMESVVDILNLPKSAQVVDVGCGRGELLLRLAERFGVSVVGLDQSRAALALAKGAFAARAPQAKAEWIEGAVVDSSAVTPASFDLVSWIGGPYVGGSLETTIEALESWLRPGGYLLVGHGFWKQAPPADYLAATGILADEFGEHHETIALGESHGLRLQTCVVSNRDEWDHFEGTILANSERWAFEHPKDPDPSGRLQQRRDWGLAQQRWGRDTMGFGLYLFRKGA